MNSPKQTRSVGKGAGRDKAVAGGKQRSGSSSSLSDSAVSDPAAAISPAIMKVIELSVKSYFESDNLLPRITAIVESSIQQFVGGLSASLETANKTIDSLNSEVESLKVSLEQKDAALHELNTALQDRVEDHEQYNRRYNLRIFGVPESEGENTDELVIQLARDRLKIKMNESHIDRSHRVGRRPPRTTAGYNTAAASNPRPRPIIVRFTSYRARREMFSNKRALKGTPYVVREDLTKERMDIFNKDIDLFGARQVWSLDGVIHWIDKDGVRGSATPTRKIQ